MDKQILPGMTCVQASPPKRSSGGGMLDKEKRFSHPDSHHAVRPGVVPCSTKVREIATTPSRRSTGGGFRTNNPLETSGEVAVLR